MFYGGGHVTMAIPVIKELLKREHEVVPIALTTAGKVMEREGLAYNTILDYVDYKKVKQYGETLIKKHHTEGKGISLNSSIAYLGTLLEELIEDEGEAKAKQEYTDKGLNAFCPVRAMQRILRQEKPDVVIATTSPRMEMALLRAAHIEKVPSLCMVDLFAILELPWLSRNDNGRFLSVYSERVATRLIDKGRSPNNIKILGNPAFDQLTCENDSKLRKKWLEKYGVDESKKIIFWAEQPEIDNPDLPRRIREKLSKICNRNPQLQLVVRLHPSSTDATKEIIPDGVVKSNPEDSLHELIEVSDLIITLTSTVAMEALLKNKNVLVVAVSQYSHLVDYSDQDGAYVIDKIEFIEDSIIKLLYDQKLKIRLEKNRKRLPKAGNSAVKICDFIESDNFLK